MTQFQKIQQVEPVEKLDDGHVDTVLDVSTSSDGHLLVGKRFPGNCIESVCVRVRVCMFVLFGVSDLRGSY